MRIEKRNEEDDYLFIAKIESKEIKKPEEANLTEIGKRLLSIEELGKITCYFYNKKGHFTNKCFKIMAEKRKNKEEVNQTEIEFEYLFSTFIENHKNKQWYLDLGSTMHMSFNKNWFKGYVDLKKSRSVKMEDHSEQKGMGMGDILLKLKNENFGILSNVLYVPSLKNNLLSINKISDLGFSINFTREKCVILDKEMKLIAMGTRDGNIYSPSENTNQNETSLNTSQAI